jgi:hypothetical protein
MAVSCAIRILLYWKKPTDFRLSQWLAVDVNLAFGCLHRVDVSNVADVSDKNSTSIFRYKLIHT